MQTTLAGRGPKCRVCTHPERTQIESLLARGAGIAAIAPIMREAFSRRALYRHRAKHMIYAVAPAARPVAFPRAASLRDRLSWLVQEAEHTAALAEAKGDLRLKLKALHEMARMIWLESRLDHEPEPAFDVTSEESLAQWDLQLLQLPEGWKVLNELRARRQARSEAAARGEAEELSVVTGGR